MGRTWLHILQATGGFQQLISQMFDLYGQFIELALLPSDYGIKLLQGIFLKCQLAFQLFNSGFEYFQW